MRLCFIRVTGLLTLALVSNAAAQQAPSSGRVTLSAKLQIPGDSLKPGAYTFAVEDRLNDRAIVRITAADGKYLLLLTTPNPQLRATEGSNLLLFNSESHKQILRGWMCPGCTATLEFVYSKVEAAAITSATREAVLAVDPESDKLPTNLSADDLKVVTLWLLTPKRLTEKDRQKGVIAQKYQPTTGAEQVAKVRAPAPVQSAPPSVPLTDTPAPAQIATATVPNQIRPIRRTLPKTATNNFSMLLGGFLLMSIGGGVLFARQGEVR